MTKRITCIECPQGCALTVDIVDGKAAKVTGNKCPKGLGYAIAETEYPLRILTSTVVADGLEVGMVPVRTDRPIPKSRLTEAMEAVRAIRIRRPVRAGEVIAGGFLGLAADLVATRDCGPSKKIDP